MKTLILLDQINNKKLVLEAIKKNNNFEILPLNIKSKLFSIKNNFPNTISTNHFFKNQDHKLAIKIGSALRKNIRRNIKKNYFKLNRYEAFSIWLSNIIIFKYFNKNLFKIIVIRNILKTKEYQKIIFVSNISNFKFENEITKNNIYSQFEFIFQKKEKISIFRKILENINNFFLFIYNFLIKINLNNKIILSSINYNLTDIKTSRGKVFLIDQKLNILTIIKLFIKKNIITKLIYSKKKYKLDKNSISNTLKLFQCTSSTFNLITKYCLDHQIDDISQEINNIENSFIRFKKLISKCKNIYYISPFSFGLSGLIGEYLKSINFKSLCIPHGTIKTGFLNKFEMIYNKEIAESIIDNKFSHVAIQSMLSNEAFNYFNKSSKKIITEPICFSVLKNKPINSNILYASTFKGENNMKFYGVETFDEYYETTRDLVNLFKNMNYNLIIQPHPTLKDNLSNEDIFNLFNISTKNVIISQDSFKENLKKSSLLISYSSTVLEECLLSNIPVIIYDKWNRYNHLSNFSGNQNKIINYFNNLNDFQVFLMSYQHDRQSNSMSDFKKFKINLNHLEIDDSFL